MASSPGFNPPFSYYPVGAVLTHETRGWRSRTEVSLAKQVRGPDPSTPDVYQLIFDSYRACYSLETQFSRDAGDQVHHLLATRHPWIASTF